MDDYVPPACPDDEDPDLICALMQAAGYSQEEIDEQAPLDCANHWLSKKEYDRRVRIVGRELY